MASKKDSKKESSTKKAEKGSSTAKTDSSSKSKSERTTKSSRDPVTSSAKTVTIAKGKFVRYFMFFLVIILSVILVDFAFQYINNDYSVAVVNGERVPTSEYEDRLKEAYGEVIATQLINERLIMQEAEEEGIEVTDEDVQAMVDETIEQLGGEEEFQTALAANGLTEDTYRRNLRIQLIAEELIVEEPTDEELQDFYAQYQEVYWTTDTKYEDVEEEVKDVYRTQKFNEESPVWLADLRAESDIQDNVADKPSYGILKITRDSISSLNNRIEDNTDSEDTEETEDDTDSEDTEDADDETGTEENTEETE